jgi:hypothetical protein
LITSLPTTNLPPQEEEMSEFIDNQSNRQEALKRVIRQLHEGKTVDVVKGEQRLEDEGE